MTIQKLPVDQHTFTMNDVRKMIQKIQINSNYGWMPIKEKIKPQFTYQPGKPGGWIDGRREGWYSEVDPQEYFEMHRWCEQNLKHGTWYTGIYYIFIEREEDVAWFMLRWS
jgi:hypothetical protein